MNNYDYIIVGSGIYGCTLANLLKEKGKRVLIIEKRNHIGGNAYTKKEDGITVHMYGPHIFHTSDENVWKYVNNFTEFNSFVNSPIANYNGELYNLPFNMNTFTRIWDDVKTPEEAKRRIEEERKEIKEITNLEEQAISLVGRTIYEKLIKGYTTKQWGKDPRDLDPSIIKRLPVRFTFDNNYFSDKYQGIPTNGYTQMCNKMIEGIDIIIGVDYLDYKKFFDSMCDKVIYTGSLDEYFGYCLGELEYRSLDFKTTSMPVDNYQGNAVINYTGLDTPYTRVIEHKHFENSSSPRTIVTFEYPIKYERGKERYYSVNDEKNMQLYRQYMDMAIKEGKIIPGGRLGEYKYYDMDDTISSAMKLSKKL